jgi:hypothetical protein
MDTTDAIAAITLGGTAIGVIAVASLVVHVGLKMWKKLRAAA